MKRINGVLASVVAVLVTVGTSGCQSGWKFSNPFSQAPKASHAEAPDELDDDFAEVDDITPPPENYTVGDSEPKKEKTSLAQKGKYGSELDESPIALEKTIKNSDDATEASQTQSYAQNAPTSETDSYSVGVSQNDFPQSAPSSLADTVASLNPDPVVAAASQPYTPHTVASTGLYSSSEQQMTTNTQPIAQNDYPATQNVAVDSYPTATNTLYNDNPIAQVSGATTQTPDQSSALAPRSESVAFNYELGSSATSSLNQSLDAPSAPYSDVGSDPYSDVMYAPQTSSGGFAPGSVLY